MGQGYLPFLTSVIYQHIVYNNITILVFQCECLCSNGRQKCQVTYEVSHFISDSTRGPYEGIVTFIILHLHLKES